MMTDHDQKLTQDQHSNEQEIIAEEAAHELNKPSDIHVDDDSHAGPVKADQMPVMPGRPFNVCVSDEMGRMPVVTDAPSTGALLSEPRSGPLGDAVMEIGSPDPAVMPIGGDNKIASPPSPLLLPKNGLSMSAAEALAKGQLALVRLKPLLDEDTWSAADDELPVRPRLRDKQDRDLGLILGLNPASRDAVRLCRNAIILSLSEAHTIGIHHVHYARDTNAYKRGGGAPHHWTYRNVMDAIDECASALSVVIDHRVGPQNPASPNYVPRRSSVSAGPGFSFPADCVVDAMPDLQQERLVLRDRGKLDLPIPACSIAEETVRFFSRYDAALSGVDIQIVHDEIIWRSSTVGYVKSKNGFTRIDTCRTQLARIFSGSMQDGGRFFSVFWAEVPKRLRSHILIDGLAVFEHDFSACHLRLAYFAAGSAAPVGPTATDLYALDGYGAERRSDIKRSVSILFNARHYSEAHCAIAVSFQAGSAEERLSDAAAMIEAIKLKHPLLEHFWHSRCGLGLQFVDSEIARLCVERLLDLGVVALTVHDSLIVQARHKDLLVRTMEDVFATDGKRLAVQRFADLRKHARSKKSRTKTDSPRGTKACGTLRAPSAIDVSPADLSSHPVIADLKAIAVGRGRWTSGMVRSVLVTACAVTRSMRNSEASARAMFAELSSRGLCSPEKAMVEREATRLTLRKGRVLHPQSLARLCGVSIEEANRLQLRVLVPLLRRRPAHAQARRTKRMESGTLPSFVDLGVEKPWVTEGKSRSRWFNDCRDPMDRRLRGLDAAFARGDPQAIKAAELKVFRALAARLEIGTAELAIDRLLDQAMKRFDIRSALSGGSGNAVVVFERGRVSFLVEQASTTDGA
jgi:hypothetical protein